LTDPRAKRSAAVLLACLVFGAWGAVGGTGCSNSVLDKCIDVCRHVFFDCQGVLKIGNEILTASDEPACEAQCHSIADGGGGGLCKDLSAGFDCLSDISCDVFQPNAGPDGGALVSECQVKGQCGQ
jgi:hypothetical protein